MISKFVREQKRYSKNNLKEIFECSEEEVVKIVKRLKEYGVMKTVRNTHEQRELSDLVDEDVEVFDEDNLEDDHLYVFVFVGVIIVYGRVLKCYPKYIYKTAEPRDELRQIIKVLQQYNSKQQIIRMYNDGKNSSAFNLLAVIIFLLNDYYENGVYSNTRNVIESNGNGEIDWNRTINETFAFINGGRPYYVDMRTRKRVNDNFDYFKRLHECVLTTCSKELAAADLMDLFDLTEVKLSEEDLDDFGDKDYVLYRIQNELNVQFNTQKQSVLKTLYSYMSHRGALSDIDSFSMFGTNSFNLVWEKVCAEVLDNQLHTQLRALDLPSELQIPEGSQYGPTDELIDVIGKPKWMGRADDREPFEKEAEQTLTPDLITIKRSDGEYSFIIFDAKYYTIQLDVQKPLRGQPGVSDVTKQYLYQLAFRDFTRKNGILRVKNCFLMPTEEDTIIEKGTVRMDMLSALELEQIQIRQLSAQRMYAYYLMAKKMDIDQLNL